MKGGALLNDVVTHGFLSGTSLLLACIVVSIAVFVCGISRNVAASFNTKLSNVNASIEDSDLVQYDGTTVKGSDVVNCIKKFSGSVEVVINKYCGASATSAVVQTWSTSSLSGDFKNLPSYAYDDMTANGLADGQLYVNPNADYTGVVHRNANGVITSITFNQVAYRQDAYDVPDTGNTTVVINNSNSDTDAALSDAIAGLTSASAELNNAIQNLQQTGSGASSVQAQMLAILQAMSSEILPAMSTQIDELALATGTGTGLADDITEIKGKIAALYSMVESAGLTKNEYTIDDVYANTQIANRYLTQIADTTSDTKEMVYQLSNDVHSMYSSLSAQHSQMISALATISQVQAQQQTVLEQQAQSIQSISNSLSALAAGISRMRTTIANQQQTITNQANTIYQLQQELASRPASVTTVGELEDYLDLDAEYVDKAKELTASSQQLMNVLQTISDGYRSLAMNCG